MTKKLKTLFINAVIVVVVWGSITLGLAAYMGAQGLGPLAGNSIHPLEEAVYIAGEACTINTPLNRSVDNMRVAFEECAQLHTEWRELEGVRQ